jgi:hypothetical protein
MKYFTLLALLIFSVGTVHSQTAKVSIGDFIEGGVVFFVDDTGEHGLVCSVNNKNTTTTWAKRKPVNRNERMSENFHTSETIFGGKSSKIKRNSRKNAKKWCDDLKIKIEGVVYKDWYLPTIEELHLLHQQKDLINAVSLKNNGQEFINSIYWSATEFDYTNAVVINFKDGKEGHYYKNYLYNVRAIRAF